MYSGALWTANQWNEDEAPGGSGAHNSISPITVIVNILVLAAGAWDKTATCAAALEPATAAVGAASGKVSATLTGAAAKATKA